MNRDPWTNMQLRAERRLHNPNAIEGPYFGNPMQVRLHWPDVAVLVACVVAVVVVKVLA